VRLFEQRGGSFLRAASPRSCFTSRSPNTKAGALCARRASGSRRKRRIWRRTAGASSAGDECRRETPTCWSAGIASMRNPSSGG
jgi:hypothetical protein